MLDSLFQRPHHVRRLRSNPLGTILDQFAEYLARRGHTACVVHQFLRAAEHYGCWLGTRNAAVSPGQVTEASIREFLYEHLGECSCPARFPRPGHEPGGRQPPAANARPAGPGPIGVAAGTA